MTHSDAQSNPAQAASEAQPDVQVSQYGGGSAMLDAEAALSEQDISDPIEGEPAASNADPSSQANSNAGSHNAASGYAIDTEQADANIATTDVNQSS
ncbi:MAG: hypothetical protein F6K28_56095 [Microcoleus sp. SIO2G3]|nr:hypothetical protein [Microcoleus sp. SIO2G3]